MSDDNVIDITDIQIKKARNLKPYRNLTDDQIRERLAARATSKQGQKRVAQPKNDYDKRFNIKFNELSSEYTLDMNNSNDVEGLRTLVRLQIQSENLSRDIDELQRSDTRVPEDYRNLKNLTDSQSTTLRGIAEIQEKLGINRKQRKEKQEDDIPKFISNLLDKAKEQFDLKTTIIMCPKCQIELMRIWLNFPDELNKIQNELTCWRCKERVLYAR